MLKRPGYIGLLLVAIAAGFAVGYFTSPESNPDAETQTAAREEPLSPEVGMFPPDSDALTLPEQITPEWLQQARREIRDVLHVP